MPLTTLTGDELFQEIADFARDQGVNSQTRWAELVEEVVEDHLALGEIDLDDDTETMKEDLRGKWKEYKRESALEEAEGTVEDENEIINKDEEEKEEID